MDLSKRQESREDALNDSWVELHFQQQQQQQQSLHQSTQIPKPGSIQMEKLLLEAQKESRNASQSTSREGSKPGSRDSPKSPQSPNNDVTAPLTINVGTDQEERLKSVVNRQVETDWVWDWSSRPEAIPPSDFAGKFKHPVKHRSALPPSSLKKPDGWLQRWTMYDLFTYACTFCLGASAMLVYIKHYLKWGPPHPRLAAMTLID